MEEEREFPVCEFKKYDSNQKAIYDCSLTPYEIFNFHDCWKTIPNYGDYIITLCGEIISLKREEYNFLKPNINVKGQYKICLCDKKRKLATTISKLMLETFISPRPICKAQARHIDTIYSNNSIDNLKWDRPFKTKLKKRDIPLIKHARFVEKLKFREIAAIFDVTITAIQAVCSNRTWRFLQKL